MTTENSEKNMVYFYITLFFVIYTIYLHDAEILIVRTYVFKKYIMSNNICFETHVIYTEVFVYYTKEYKLLKAV